MTHGAWKGPSQFCFVFGFPDTFRKVRFRDGIAKTCGGRIWRKIPLERVESTWVSFGLAASTYIKRLKGKIFGWLSIKIGPIRAWFLVDFFDRKHGPKPSNKYIRIFCRCMGCLPSYGQSTAFRKGSIQGCLYARSTAVSPPGLHGFCELAIGSGPGLVWPQNHAAPKFSPLSQDGCPPVSCRLGPAQRPGRWLARGW